ncbi:class I SAM-dependent methyltransferase [Candidatus Gracilibacteria bacterium]|jgi:ubiquinone/menaquinone biosynthesis C-methylase UbiE|nr:class I SAM-dependent methyltransferase [Candidatus Gracilibacteria bacterium]
MTFTPEQFVASSIVKYGKLNEYIQEKLVSDFSAIKGNMLMAEGLKNYIKENLETLKAKQKIEILDIGPAIGALSTLFTLQALNEFGLMEKAQIHLFDVSAKVIEQTLNCKFFFPDSIIDPKLKNPIHQKLRQAKGEVGSAENLPWKNEKFDIVLAGFLFCCVHDSVKPSIAKEMQRVAKKSGFIGIAETLEKKTFSSPISAKLLEKLFKDAKIAFKSGKSKDEAYIICMEK